MTLIAVGRLVLVRHAMPEVDPAIPAERWRLGPDGRTAARALAPLVATPAYFVASDEPKAVETLRQVAGRLAVATDSGFREVQRPHVWSSDGDYRALARAYLEDAEHDGWEAHAAVVRRFGDAVVRHAELAAAVGGTLIIGTHGLAATVWLASLLPVRPSPAQFWSGLRLPDVVEVDLVAGTVSRCPVTNILAR